MPMGLYEIGFHRWCCKISEIVGSVRACGSIRPIKTRGLYPGARAALVGAMGRLHYNVVGIADETPFGSELSHRTPKVARSLLV